MKILLVEDDEKILKVLKRALKGAGYRVDSAKDAEEGLYLAKNNDYDVLVLDWMLPKKSGLELAKEIKNIKNYPILMLTAKRDLEDKIKGLEVVDDYLTKPFDIEELIARLRALYRRSNNLTSNIIKVADLELDPEAKIVKRAGKEIELTAKQFELLKYLMINKNRVVSVDMIANNLWDMEDDITSNVINVYISHLRKKIDKDFDKKLIKTVRGMGFKIVDDK